LAAAQF